MTQQKFERIKDEDPEGLERRVWYVLKGPLGAVQFMYLKETPNCPDDIKALYPNGVMGADVGYHSPRPMYEGQEPRESCEYLGLEPCYYDGSGLRAMEWAAEIFALPEEQQEKLIWAKLEEEYAYRFEDKDPPASNTDWDPMGGGEKLQRVFNLVQRYLDK